MKNKQVKQIGFDESFKILAKHFFSRFSKVITDFEIIKLPKKTDVLIIETEKPIKEYVRLFTYFKKFNIIEFKSVQDLFRINKDLPKMLIYIGGLLLNEEAANLNNTTFTILSSRKPAKLFTTYKKHIQKIKNGVYLIKHIVQIPVHVILANEVEGGLDREFALVKEFSTGRERIRFIEKVLHEVLKGNDNLAEYLHFAFSLYISEISKIIEKEGMSMTIVEKNIEAWNKKLGLKEKYIKEGEKRNQLSVAKKMLAKGFSIDDIIDTTGLSMEEIRTLQEESS